MSIELREAPIDGSLLKFFGEGPRLLNDFVDVASYIFRDDPCWVQPLDFDLKGRLTPKNPFFEHAEGVLLVAYRNGKPVGRCTAHIDREHLARYNDSAANFGFFDTVDDPEVARLLLERAEAWAKQRGAKVIRGPHSFSTNEELGCLVEGFDTPPMVLMPHHRAYQGGLIEKAGYSKLKDLYAWRYTTGDVPKRARKAAEEIEAMPEVTMRPVDLNHTERDVRLIMDIFNDAWSDNWGFVPLTESELKKTAADLKMLIVPDLTEIVSIDGEAVAVCVALPNINSIIRDFKGKLNPVTVAKLLYRLKVEEPDTARVVILGIRKKLRHVRKYAGLSTYMYVKINEAGIKHKIRWAELSWTLEDNGPVNVGIKFMGGKVYKRYRLYEKSL